MQLLLAGVAAGTIPPCVCRVFTKQLSCLSVKQIFVKGDCVPSTVIGAAGDSHVVEAVQRRGERTRAGKCRGFRGWGVAPDILGDVRGCWGVGMCRASWV